LDVASHMTVQFIQLRFSTPEISRRIGTLRVTWNWCWRTDGAVGSRRDLARHRPRFSQPSRVYALMMPFLINAWSWLHNPILKRVLAKSTMSAQYYQILQATKLLSASNPILCRVNRPTVWIWHLNFTSHLQYWSTPLRIYGYATDDDNRVCCMLQVGLLLIFYFFVLRKCCAMCIKRIEFIIGYSSVIFNCSYSTYFYCRFRQGSTM